MVRLSIVPFARIEKRMLRKTLPRQLRRRIAGRRSGSGFRGTSANDGNGGSSGAQENEPTGKAARGGSEHWRIRGWSEWFGKEIVSAKSEATQNRRMRPAFAGKPAVQEWGTNSTKAA